MLLAIKNFTQIENFMSNLSSIYSKTWKDGDEISLSNTVSVHSRQSISLKISNTFDLGVQTPFDLVGGGGDL